jgi:hypothetical protein
MSTLPSVILGVLGLVPSIFKHKPFCLWYWEPPKWILKAGPFSSRQCRRQKAALVSIGMDETRFRVLRKGVEPPPFFNPPKVEEKR